MVSEICRGPVVEGARAYRTKVAVRIRQHVACRVMDLVEATLPNRPSRFLN